MTADATPVSNPLAGLSLGVALAVAVVLLVPDALAEPYAAALAVAVGMPVIHALAGTHDVPDDAAGGAGPPVALALAAVASGSTALVAGATVGYLGLVVDLPELLHALLVVVVALVGAKVGFQAALGDHPWTPDESATSEPE